MVVIVCIFLVWIVLAVSVVARQGQPGLRVCIFLGLLFLAVAVVARQDLLGVVAFTTLSCVIPGLCALSIQYKSRRASSSFKVATKEYTLSNTLYWRVFVEDTAQLHGHAEGLADHDRVAMWIAENTRRAWVPIVLILLLSSVFGAVIVYSADLLAAPHRLADLLLLGSDFSPGTDGNQTVNQAALLKSLTAVAYAFLGWYAWSISSIFSRMISMELAPATYYTILMRLLIAAIVALALERMVSILLPEWAGRLSPEAIGFGIGLFPDSALTWLTDKLRTILLGKGEGLEEMPLDLIQGISPFRRLRLQEMGLDNCQNLASANAIELFLMSNLKLVEVVDWIAQAQLAVLVHTDLFKRLQKNGYRHAADFERACHKQKARDVLAGITKFKNEQLEDLADGMATSPSYVRMDELRKRIVPDALRAAIDRSEDVVMVVLG